MFEYPTKSLLLTISYYHTIIMRIRIIALAVMSFAFALPARAMALGIVGLHISKLQLNAQQYSLGTAKVPIPELFIPASLESDLDLSSSI